MVFLKNVFSLKFLFFYTLVQTTKSINLKKKPWGNPLKGRP